MRTILTVVFPAPIPIRQAIPLPKRPPSIMVDSYQEFFKHRTPYQLLTHTHNSKPNTINATNQSPSTQSFPKTNPAATMCNNMFSVCRSTCCRPVPKTGDLPQPISSAGHPAAATTTPQAPLPVAAPVPQAQLPDRPMDFQPIPAFNPDPTVATFKASFKKQAQANVDAIKADRALRKQRVKQLRKLRSHKAAQQAAARLPWLPRVARSDVDGLTAAKQLTPQQAPAQMFSHESIERKCRQYGNNPLAHNLVKTNIWQHSTMMSVVDLRDDPIRNFDGKILRRGAIYEPETGLNATKVNLQIYVEMSGNKKRALREFRRVALSCPAIQSLSVEVIGEDNEAPAHEVLGVLKRHFDNGRSGFGAAVTADFTSSLHESEG